MLLTGACSASLHATVIYVDSAHVSGTKTGTSWATAFSDVQTAIDSARVKDTIWVAKGTYQHYYSASAFAMKDSVKMFGGFLNTHTSFQSRNWTANPTVLKGNGYMVILNSFTNTVGPEAWLDGFTVTGGTRGGMENSFSSPTINNCTFINNTNTSTSSGAGMQNSFCSSVITNCRFINNTGAVGVGNGGFGAFPPQNAAGPTFVNCVFSGNSGVNAGGVTNAGCIVNYTNCDFTGNKCTINGGAMANNQAVINITNCRFTNNQTTEKGGGIYQDKCISTITGCSFVGNSSESGGGIANESDTAIRYMVLSHTRFEGNKATNPKGTGTLYSTDRFGGGVYNRGKATISYCSFLNNTAGYLNYSNAGGGLFSTVVSTNATSPNTISTISNCRFINNKALLVGGLTWYGANAMGGGALVYHGNVTDCIFEGNEATVRGGGLAIGSTSTTSADAIADRCQFVANSSSRGGGVFANTGAIISNSLIAKNTSDSTGGGVEVDIYQGYKAALTNNTIACNYARKLGGAIYFYAYTAITNPYKISNNIIWGNNSGIDKLTAIPAPAITYSLVQGVSANTANHVLNGSTNPLFVDTAAGIFQLLPASPCIDTGRNDSLAAAYNMDLLNHARINHATIDLGAYEYGIYPPVAVLGNDTTVCSNIKLKLKLLYQSGTSYSWSTGDTTWSTVVTTPGKYYVTVTNALGTASDTIVVKHNAAPVVNLGVDTSVCGKIFLDAKNPGATYLWSTGATTQNIRVNAGTYSAVVTDTNSCRSVDTIKVLQLPVPIVTLGADIFATEGQDIILDAGIPGDTYLWNTGDTTQTIKVTATGKYSVTVTNRYGCSGSDEIEVSIASTGINETAAANSMLSIHPNPARDLVNIRVNDPKLLRAKLTLYDAFGRAVRTVPLEKSEQQLSLDGLASGIYLLKAESGRAWKLVKQ